MKHVRTAIWIYVVSIVFVLSAEQTSARDRIRLWYDEPASKWTEAMPLGNGRLGAMVFGTVLKERLQLNEESLWAGEPTDVYPEDFSENLRKLQDLILKGRISEARELGLAKLTKSPTSFRSYEPLADLWIEMDHVPEIEEYRRQLDLQTGRCWRRPPILKCLPTPTLRHWVFFSLWDC